jgi:septal ring factor EnvC (AmiA/AmiB activator)
MVRLLVGVPLRSDGKLTVKSLAEEAGLRRNKLTHKHTGLKDLFCALTQAQDHRPRIADDLQAANADLTDQLKKVTQERNTLREDRATLARVVHVLEVENDALRTALEAQEGIVNLASRRTAPA